MPSTALFTDHYELTMLDAALRSGVADRHSVFEVTARRLPPGRRYGVMAGVDRLPAAIEAFRFGRDEIAHLRGSGVVSPETLEWLARYRFRGDIWSYHEGEVYVPGTPLLVVEATFGEAVLLETLVLSILNHDCAIAAAASRMVGAAAGRPLIEMGSRRTHEAAAVDAARVAYLCGFASTSNLEAGRRYGIPTVGTSAHSFTLAHDSEAEAFAAQVAALGTGTTLLVDTYDVTAAVDSAVLAAGTGLGAVRLDSGDLPTLASSVRAQLDGLGARATRIIVTGDLDEHAIAALAASPVDGYGVGTQLVTGSGAPTAGLIYKLVARAIDDDPTSPMTPVAKTSPGKHGRGGRKAAYRRLDDAGQARADVVRLLAPNEGTTEGLATAPPAGHRALLHRLVANGNGTSDDDLERARSRHARSLAELPAARRDLAPGDPALSTQVWGPAHLPGQGDGLPLA